MKRLRLLSIFCLTSQLVFSQSITFYVSSHGSDQYSGSLSKPFLTPEQALQSAALQNQKDVKIVIREGIYHLKNTIQLDAAQIHFKSLLIQAFQNEKVVWSGASAIHPVWKKWKPGIWKSNIVSNEKIDRLYLNGKSLPMARYPDYDKEAGVFFGSSEKALDSSRIANWKNPAGGFIHALHSGEWGGLHFLIKQKTPENKLIYEGGWQNNRPSPMHKKFRFVENIFEELDAPGEWYYQMNEQALYLIPPTITDLQQADMESGHLTNLLQIKGSVDKPAANITISGIEFRQTNRSFMLTKEPLLRSDWTIYRGGAILLEGTENIRIERCVFTELGGNAVFVSNYNKNVLIRNNHISNIGASAILFVGSPDAVRSPAFQYGASVPWNVMDRIPGSKSKEYPQYCTAENNLIHHIGLVEKQVAGVQIEMASHIKVDHNSIYEVPRAGINIGDGCWGGHLIQYNDVFNTVLETGDHGAFNSWGRDRFWSPDRKLIDSIVAAIPGIELWDVQNKITIRNNRFHCEHGWDIDLDDGSTNYEIYNNLCLSGGLKLREGYHRKVTNNILINNTFHPHVWLKNSDDLFKFNIVTNPYAPIQIDDWGKQVDSNYFLNQNGLEKAQKLGIDLHSSWGDADFENTGAGKFTVKSSSPAVRIGFKPFEFDFGVTDPALRKMAEKPGMIVLQNFGNEAHSSKAVWWLGASIKNIETLGEQSAAGLPDKKGVVLMDFHLPSILEKNHLKKGDVIVKMADEQINTVAELLKVYESVKWTGKLTCIIVRNQRYEEIQLFLK